MKEERTWLCQDQLNLIGVTHQVLPRMWSMHLFVCSATFDLVFFIHFPHYPALFHYTSIVVLLLVRSLQPAQRETMRQKHSYQGLSFVITLLLALTQFWSSPAEAFGGSHSKVLLRDVQTLTLYRGKMTAGRRSSPVPQISCVGGNACGDYQPGTLPVPVSCLCCNSVQVN